MAPDDADIAADLAGAEVEILPDDSGGGGPTPVTLSDGTTAVTLADGTTPVTLSV